MDLTRITTLEIAPAVSLFAGGQPYDLVGLADLKEELNITSTASDAYMAKLISRSSAAAQTYCNRTFVPATWQEQVWPAKGYYPWQLPPTMTRLQLSNYPLLTTPSLAGTGPPQLPALALVSTPGLGAARYFVRLTYLTAMGETATSLEANINCPANQGFTIGAPGADSLVLATGYNVYVSTTSYAETLQNVAPIGINSGWTLPGSGVVTGAAAPSFITIVENAALGGQPLAEGVDFEVDTLNGFVDRLWYVNAQPKVWTLPATTIYPAGYSTLPGDIQDAVLLIAKFRWFARTRDPSIRSQNAEGIYSAQYVMGTGPGGSDDMPADATAKLDRYRTPVIA